MATHVPFSNVGRIVTSIAQHFGQSNLGSRKAVASDRRLGFHELAVFLSTHKHRPRRVVAMDFRGRGGSGYDRNWKNYSPMVEMADVLDVLVARGIEAATFVGTSRGGLVTMLLAAARPF